MALIQDGRAVAFLAAVEQKTKAIRVTSSPRGAGYTLSSTSGVIAAAQAAGSCFWAMRISATSAPYFAFIEKIRFQFTTLAAFTAQATAGRRLSLYRGSGAAASGGTALSAIQKDPSANLTNVANANGGDARISTTTALGVSGITWESAPFREMAISHCGPAASNNEDIYEFQDTSAIILQPGQLLGIRNPQAMDAGGTWQISVDVDFHESVAWSSTVAD